MDDHLNINKTSRTLDVSFDLESQRGQQQHEHLDQYSLLSKLTHNYDFNDESENGNKNKKENDNKDKKENEYERRKENKNGKENEAFQGTTELLVDKGDSLRSKKPKVSLKSESLEMMLQNKDSSKNVPEKDSKRKEKDSAGDGINDCYKNHINGKKNSIDSDHKSYQNNAVDSYRNDSREKQNSDDIEIYNTNHNDPSREYNNDMKDLNYSRKESISMYRPLSRSEYEKNICRKYSTKDKKLKNLEIFRDLGSKSEFGSIDEEENSGEDFDIVQDNKKIEVKKKKMKNCEKNKLKEVWQGEGQDVQLDTENEEIEDGEKVVKREGEGLSAYSTLNNTNPSIPKGSKNNMDIFENNASNKNNYPDARSARNLNSRGDRRPSTESSSNDRKGSSNYFGQDRQNLGSAMIPELVLVPLRDKTLYESPMPFNQPHTYAQHMTEKQFLDWSLREKPGLNSIKMSSSSLDQNFPKRKNSSQRKDSSQSSTPQLFDKEYSPRKRLESFQLNDRGEYSLLSPIRPNTGYEIGIKNQKNKV